MLIRGLLTASFLVSFGVNQAFGGAWTQKEGGTYLKLQGGYLNSTEDIDADGKRAQKGSSGGSLRDLNYSVYLEYGLLEGSTVVVSLPYKRMVDKHNFVNLEGVLVGIAREKRFGFGDLELRFRQRIREVPFVLSVAVGGKVPLWYDDDPGTRVPLSSRKLDVDVRFLLGRSLYPFPGYVTGEVGYRVRGGAFSDEAFYAVEGGVTLGRVLIKGFASGIRTTGECAAGPSSPLSNLIGDQNVLKLSPGLIYRMHPRLELSLDLIHVATGCNTAAGNTFIFGVAFKR